MKNRGSTEKRSGSAITLRALLLAPSTDIAGTLKDVRSSTSYVRKGARFALMNKYRQQFT